MNFFEAMTMLHQGKKVRAVAWEKGQYVGLKETGFKFCGLGKTAYSLLDQSGKEPSMHGNTGGCIPDYSRSPNFLSGAGYLNACVQCDWEEFKD